MLVLATSAGGKSTLTRYLRKSTTLTIFEVDEELLAARNNVWPEAELIHNTLISQITRKLLSGNCDIFFSKDMAVDLVKEVKDSGAKVVMLDVNIECLRSRNAKRMTDEGYSDISPWLQGQLDQLSQIKDAELVDEIVDGNLSVEHIAAKLVSIAKQP